MTDSAWGGDRPGSGRKPDPNSNRQRRLRERAARRQERAAAATKPGKPKAQPKSDVSIFDPTSMASIEAIIRMSNERAKSLQRRPELNPFTIRPDIQHPPQARPRDKSMHLAMDSVTGLGWAETQWAGGYLSNVAAEGLLFLGYPYLSELAQRPEYRVISETISTEMTRKWIKFTSTGESEAKKRDSDEGKEAFDRAMFEAREGNAPEPEKAKDPEDKDDNAKQEKIKELVDFQDGLRVRDRFADIALYDGFLGRSHLYYDSGATDEELKTPIGNGRDELSKAKVGKKFLKGLKTIEATWTYPTTYNAQNPLLDDWYNPQVWYVMGREIHRSRLPTFVGRPVPDLLKPAYSFGGLSLSQMAKPYVDIWLTTRQSVADLIHSFSVMVLMTDLQTILQPGNAGALLARAALFNALRDNQGLMVVNKSTEDFKNVSASLSGLHELQSQSQEHMMSVARIPAVKFTGMQPQGLNASSEGEMRAFNDTIHAYQHKLFKPHLDTTNDFCMLSLWGERDEEIVYDFESLVELTDKEKGELKKLKAETGQIHIDTGVISPEEERDRIIADPDSDYQGLDPDDVPELAEEEEGGLVPKGAGGGVGAVLGEGGKPPGAGGGPAGKDAAIVPFGADAEWNEGDHPRGQPGNAGQFGSGGGGSKSGGSEAKETESGSGTEQPTFKTKKEHASHLLEKGATAKELMTALGWPSISVPATAKSVGMTLKKVKDGKTTRYYGTPMTAAERKAAGLMPEGVKRSGGPASRDPGTWSLLEFIVSRGGIDPKDALIGDVRSMLGTKNRFVPGFGSLIRPGGMRLDRMREAAVEAGYMQDEGRGRSDRQNTTTIDSLVEMMDRENRGERVYRQGQEPEHVTAAKQAEVLEENLRHHDERLDESMREAGIEPDTISGPQRDRVLQIMMKEDISDPLEAIEREAMEWNQNASDRGQAERILDDIPGWDVPDDARAAPKSGSTAAPF